MKKCASCSKDLPEAALHCVFCGAKQAPAPAVPASGVAKTAFGYSANDVMQALGNQAPPARANPPSQPPAMSPPPSRPNSGSQPPPAGYQAGGVSPHAAANAATMFASGPPPGAQPSPPAPQYGGPAPGYGAPAPGYGAPSPGYGAPSAPAYQPPPSSAGMGIHSPQQATPAPLPAVQSPYLGAQTGAARTAGRPVEPWKDPLKLWMFVWGAIALAAFATPVMTDPMAFQWDAIIHGEGKMKIPGLVWASVGLLSIVFAAIPMSTVPRGALAAVLGLAGIFVPLAVIAFPPWQFLLPMIGSLALVSGLLIRHEYVESLTARVMVTIGVVCTLAPYLIPEGGQIPLVMLFKALLNAGSGMEVVIYMLGQIVLVVLCLLAWMPGPATAGAKVFAWAVILYPILGFVLKLIGAGHIGDVISKTPGEMVSWAPGVAYSVLVGYGLATVIGKQLE